MIIIIISINIYTNLFWLLSTDCSTNICFWGNQLIFFDAFYLRLNSHVLGQFQLVYFHMLYVKTLTFPIFIRFLSFSKNQTPSAKFEDWALCQGTSGICLEYHLILILSIPQDSENMIFSLSFSLDDGYDTKIDIAVQCRRKDGVNFHATMSN